MAELAGLQNVADIPLTDLELTGIANEGGFEYLFRAYVLIARTC